MMTSHLPDTIGFQFSRACYKKNSFVHAFFIPVSAKSNLIFAQHWLVLSIYIGTRYPLPWPIEIFSFTLFTAPNFHCRLSIPCRHYGRHIPTRCRCALLSFPISNFGLLSCLRVSIRRVRLSRSPTSATSLALEFSSGGWNLLVEDAHTGAR
jgi:hypothetical protein